MRFTGKTALVTGGSSGIGEAVARAFAAEGAHVAVVASSEVARTAPIVDAIRDAGGKAHGFAADVSTASAVESLIRSVRETIGEIDIRTPSPSSQKIW